MARGFVENNATVYIVSRDGEVCKKVASTTLPPRPRLIDDTTAQVAEKLSTRGPGRCVALPSLDVTHPDAKEVVGVLTNSRRHQAECPHQQFGCSLGAASERLQREGVE